MLLRYPLALILGSASIASLADSVKLSDLDLKTVRQDYGRPMVNQNIVGKPMVIAGKPFAWGLGGHAAMTWNIAVNGATKFHAFVGVDDSSKTGRGTVVFTVYADGKAVYDSGIMATGDAPKEVTVDLKNKKDLLLRVDSAGDGISFDHADWAEAAFEFSGKKPASIVPPVEKPYILTPKPGPQPRINGPKVFGVRPGHPILFTVPATGVRPMRFEAEGLPAGAKLDPQTGFLSGSVAEKGEYNIKLTASNSKGKCVRSFKLVVGDVLALTPPMGWSTWYMAYTNITDTFVRAQAEAMASTGLINHGYSYINIDDGWNVIPGSNDPNRGGKARDDQGNLLSNKLFPDMKGMCDYVHNKGLKIGIYISPGRTTCAGYEGSLNHEEQDAKLFAKWGFDFLKYDWCSYQNEVKGDTLEEYKLPYAKMRDALLKTDRDFVYNLCQYGLKEVWKWGDEVDGNFWRTTGDLGATDSLWDSMSAIGFGQVGYEKYAKPGRWNDPDNILIGKIMVGGQLLPTTLTPNEQYTYMSLWAILASPMVLASDLTQLDEFTLSLVTNDEVIEVNQDILGKQGRRLRAYDGLEVWVRDLENGEMAVGLFNRSEVPAEVKVYLSELGISGTVQVRDLWRQKNQEKAADSISRKVPRHGVYLLKLTKVSK